MVFIEGGTFDMGSNEYDDEQPIHQVAVPNFYLAPYPVTNSDFVSFLNEEGNQEEEGSFWVNLKGNYQGVSCGIQEAQGGFECMPGLEEHPMIYVNWYGASAYCRWLSTKTGQSFRLPSEAEWEYAARGGKYQSPCRYAGSNHLDEVGWYDGNSHGQTKPVGLKYPNQLGLYDMSGNVDEWCADPWHESYKGAPDDGSAWSKGGDPERRVVRGGSWDDVGNDCRVSDRSRYYAFSGSLDIGFRVSRY